MNRGNEFASELAQNPSMTTAEDGTVERFVKIDDWFYYLDRGFRLAPIASHDNHFANWGTGHTSRTAIVATALEEGALLDALRGGSVFASEDENLELRVFADGRIRAGQSMGTTADHIALSIRVGDPDFTGPYAISVWRGTVGASAAAVVLEQELVADAWHHTIAVELPEAGQHWVVVQVHERAPDRMAWSAPIFVQRHGTP